MTQPAAYRSFGAASLKRPAFLMFTLLSSAVLSLSVIYGQWNPILVLLGLSTIGAVTIALVDCSLGLWLYLAVLPFSYFLRRLLFVVSDVSRTEWLIATVIPDAIMLAAIVGWMAKYRLRLVNTRSLLPVSLFLLWCVIEIFNPGVFILVGMAGFKKTALYICLYFLAASVTAEDPTVVGRIGRITVTCGLAASAYGLMQQWRGLADFELAPILSEMGNLTEASIDVLYPQGVLRPFSTFSGPWVFGDYVAIGLTFCPLLYWNGQRRGMGILVASLLLLSGLAVSLSRSSYLMLICSLGLVFVWSRRSQSGRVAGFATVGAVITILSIAVVQNQAIVAPGAATAILSTENVFGRFEQWQSLLGGSGTFSLAGHGIGSIQAAYAFGQEGVAEAHSFVLSLLLEVGVVGLLLFSWVCASVFWRALKTSQGARRETERRETIFVAAILGGMLLAKSAAGGLWGLQVHDSYWWLLCGVLAGLDARLDGRKLTPRLEPDLVRRRTRACRDAHPLAVRRHAGL